MAYKIKNNAATTLAVGMNTTDTTLQVVTGKGDLFPVIAGTDYTYVTLENAAGDIEIVKVTARALGSDSMAVDRAQDGTTGKTWLIGDIVELRINAGVIDSLQADMAAHLADTADAHAASAITNTPAGNIAATTVQAALDELDSEKAAAADLTAHLNDTTAAHAASAISYAGGTGMSATDVEAAIDELATEKLNAADAFLNSILAKTAAYTVVAADRGKLIDCDGTFTLTLTAAATLGDGFVFGVRNSGTGTITIDPDGTELIDGVATITFAAGASGFVACNGTAFKTLGKAGPVADGSITAAKLDGSPPAGPPIYAPRAWVNFNGTGTVAINAQGNVGSITDNGVGDYTVNFTTAMPDANYAFTFGAQFPVNGTNGTYQCSDPVTAPTTTAIKIRHVHAGATYDPPIVAVTVLR